MIELVFMQYALAASIAAGVSLGVIGVYLAIRRVVFLGLVIANAATLGAALAQAAGWASEPVSLAVGVAAAVILGGVETTGRVSAESLMGWAYAAASSSTALVLAWVVGGSTDALHLLYGDVLAVRTRDVAGLTIIAAVIGLVQWRFGRRFLLVTFDPEAAKVAGVNTRLWTLLLNLTIGVAAAAAVPAIGALLTFALLTLPAMFALLAARSVRATFATAAILGACVPALGLVGSFYLDLPAGPVSVALLAATVPLAALSRFWTARDVEAGDGNPALVDACHERRISESLGPDASQPDHSTVQTSFTHGNLSRFVAAARDKGDSL
jgi:ABC-type Mn2+/Zn2+ transport system permease subunit